MTSWFEVSDHVKEAGLIAKRLFLHTPATKKADQSLVTKADKDAEEYLKSRLTRLFPTASFLGEESGLTKGSGQATFILDPVDGTASFAAGFPIWGPCLGYYCQGKMEAGWFYLPMLDEMYLSTADGIIFNRKPFRPQIPHQPDDLEGVLLTPSNIHRYCLLNFPGKVRSFGSTAAHALYVALGRATAAVMGPVSLWDLAGVIPALEFAGCQMRYLDGTTIPLDSIVQSGKFEKPILITAAGIDFTQVANLIECPR
jgi:myo-inositol-1(or 4)-monophosphatase